MTRTKKCVSAQNPGQVPERKKHTSTSQGLVWELVAVKYFWEYLADLGFAFSGFNQEVPVETVWIHRVCLFEIHQEVPVETVWLQTPYPQKFHLA